MDAYLNRIYISKNEDKIEGLCKIIKDLLSDISHTLTPDKYDDYLKRIDEVRNDTVHFTGPL